MDVFQMAEGFLSASAGDVVRLAHMDAPTLRQLRALDLRLLLEYERKPGGAVRVKLVDRAALLGGLMKSDGVAAGGDDCGFLEALEAAAAALDG